MGLGPGSIDAGYEGTFTPGMRLPGMDAGRRAAEYGRWRRAVDCAVLFSTAEESQRKDHGQT